MDSSRAPCCTRQSLPEGLEEDGGRALGGDKPHGTGHRRSIPNNPAGHSSGGEAGVSGVRTFEGRAFMGKEAKALEFAAGWKDRDHTV